MGASRHILRPQAGIEPACAFVRGGDFTVVSTLHLGDAVHYRVVGSPAPALHPEPTEPSLEDGYVWLMRSRRDARSGSRA